MKLFGSSGRTKHSLKDRRSAKKNVDISEPARGKKPQSRLKKRLKLLIVLLSIIFTLLVVFYLALTFYVKPPDVSTTKNPGITGGQSEGEPDIGSTPDATLGDSRTGGVYTFVVLGTDDGNGNTDTMMVISFDTKDYTFNVVSIPRDTLVNVSWAVKKANTFYSVGGTDRVVEGLADILGFPVDFYVVVNLEAFEVLVNAIDGVYYDVPREMRYKDPAQNLYIDIDAGYQKLDGEQAVKVMRFRSGYPDADIGRIGTQQDFLKTAATQVIENKDSLNITSLANIFLKYVKTDLTYGEIIWLAKEFYKVDGEKINFMTLPGDYGDSCYQGGEWVSYVTIDVNLWLDMINQYLNPFDDDIELKNLNILTRDSNGKLYSTSGRVYAGKSSWGIKTGSFGSSSGGTSSSSSGSSVTNSQSQGEETEPDALPGTPTGTAPGTDTDTQDGTDTEVGVGSDTGNDPGEDADETLTPNDGSGMGD